MVTAPMASRSGHEQQQRLVEAPPQPLAAAAALGHEAERQPHHRAERGLDRAQVDEPTRQQEQGQRNHARSALSMTPAVTPPRRRSRRLETRHPPVVGLMVVAEQVQQAVQREHAEFLRVGVAGGARLATGHAGGDDDVAEGVPLSGLARRSPGEMAVVTDTPARLRTRVLRRARRETTARPSPCPCRRTPGSAGASRRRRRVRS